MQQVLNENKSMPNLKLVDVDQRIFSVPAVELPEKIQKQLLKEPRDDVNEFTFFYHPDIDAVILNSTNVYAEEYKAIVTTYLTSAQELRDEMKLASPVDAFTGMFKLLDHVIEVRENGRD